MKVANDENPYASPGESLAVDATRSRRMPRRLRIFFWFHIALTSSPYAWLILTMPVSSHSSRMRVFELLAFFSWLSIPVVSVIALVLCLKYGSQIGWRGAVFGMLELILVTIQFLVAVPLFQ